MEPWVSLNTQGVQELRRPGSFYHDLVGRKTPYAEPDPVAFFALKGLVLGLSGWPTRAEDVGVGPQRGGFQRATLARNVRSRRAVFTLFGGLRKRSAPVVKSLQAAERGGFRGGFTSPDGHLWEGARNPGRALDRRGSVVLPR